MTEEVSNRISVMSFVCAAFVVGSHTGGEPDWLARIMCFRSIAVPSFFIIAGFLFAGKMSGVEWWKEQVKKRLKSLMLPYVIWNGMYFLFLWGLVGLAAIVGRKYGGFASLQDLMWGGWDIFGICPLRIPALGLLWFVRDLFVMVLISPLFTVCRRPVVGGFLVMSLYLILCYWDSFGPEMGGSWIIKWQSVAWMKTLAYFTIGLWLRFNAYDGVSRQTSRLVGFILFLVAVLMKYFNVPGEAFLTTPLAVIGLWWSLQKCHLPRLLTGCAFPIYLIHTFIGTVLIAAVQEFHPVSWGMNTALGWAIRYCVMLCGSVALVILGKRVAPRAIKVVFGGRV